MAADTGISTIDIAPLFRAAALGRAEVDRRILKGAEDAGIFVVEGLPPGVRRILRRRGRLFALFAAPRQVLDAIAANRHDPTWPLVQHGWFDVREGRAFHYDGMAIGADVARGASVDGAPPGQATPMPAEAELPGWRRAVVEHFLAMEGLADAVLRALARGLRVPEDEVAERFAGGASSLRLLRYPVRSAAQRARVPAGELHVVHQGQWREVINEAHADIGAMALLFQGDGGGLQAGLADGRWIDLPASEDRLVVNFGTAFERWSGGRVRAGRHRVLSAGRVRYSLPYFHEPRADALLRPFSPGGDGAPFLYGDHLWESQPRLARLFGPREAAE